jgi:hypothetical protein
MAIVDAGLITDIAKEIPINLFAMATEQRTLAASGSADPPCSGRCNHVELVSGLRH